MSCFTQYLFFSNGGKKHGSSFFYQYFFMVLQRVFYAGLGTTAMGMICFPEETKEFTKNNGTLAKQYINIAYNFLYGGNFSYFYFLK